jgi:hypothetical protein
MAKRKIRETNADDWVTVQQAAEIAGYHPNYVRRLIRENAVKGRKWANLVWQVSKQSLLAYVEKQSELGERRGAKPTKER